MHKIFLFLLIFSDLVIAKDFTKPPSIALRNEISFVSEMTLESKKHTEADKWQLSFSLVNNLHNKSKKQLLIFVPRKLAQSLELNMGYIVAYQTHKKTKVEGLKKYIAYKNGAKLLKVEGANPAIFRTNKLLVAQLQSIPEQAKTNPHEFINKIINGMYEKDPKVQEFFVRELVNWVGLHQHVSRKNYVRLSKIFNSNTATIDMITAVLGSRPSFHKFIGVKALGKKAISLLNNYPLDLDPLSGQPSLISQALTYTALYKLGGWELYSRWLGCNIPSITEKALLILNKLDPIKTKELVEIRLLDTQLSDPSRRVLKRY